MNTIWILVATGTAAAVSYTCNFNLSDYINLQYLATDFMWNGFFINFRLGLNNLGWLTGFDRGVIECIIGFEPVAREWVFQLFRDVFVGSIFITMPYRDNKNKMIYKNKYKFQLFPFHLVDPSPWPILLSFSLLNLTVGAVAYMHGFSYGGNILTLGFILTTYGMILWFRGATVRFFVELHYPKTKNS